VTTGKEISVKDWRRLANWKVRTMLQCEKLENLKIEMARIKIDILGISEIRWMRVRDLLSGEYKLIHKETTENKP